MLINKISVSELSRKFIKSVLLVGQDPTKKIRRLGISRHSPGGRKWDFAMDVIWNTIRISWIGPRNLVGCGGTPTHFGTKLVGTQ